jgi:hypothetical protein
MDDSLESSNELLESKYICNVWKFNFDEEMNKIMDIIDEYKYVSLVSIRTLFKKLILIIPFLKSLVFLKSNFDIIFIKIGHRISWSCLLLSNYLY